MRILQILILLLVSQAVFAEWKVDFSRRREEIKEREGFHSRSYKKAKKGLSSQPYGSSKRGIASLDDRFTVVPKKEEAPYLEGILERQAPAQEIVIMHTKGGFFPANVQIYKDRRYKVHVVNVHKGSKNVSFMLDSFSQHHGTFFGEPVSFTIEPRQEGLFGFQCPETAAKGNLVVTSSSDLIPSPTADAFKKRKPTAASRPFNVER